MKGGMNTVIITDCMYRSAIAAVTTDVAPCPPAFKSRYIGSRFVLSSTAYAEELFALCSKYDRPTILPMGVFTLNVLSENIEKFKNY